MSAVPCSPVIRIFKKKKCAKMFVGLSRPRDAYYTGLAIFWGFRVHFVHPHTNLRSIASSCKCALVDALHQTVSVCEQGAQQTLSW